MKSGSVPTIPWSHVLLLHAVTFVLLMLEQTSWVRLVVIAICGAVLCTKPVSLLAFVFASSVLPDCGPERLTATWIAVPYLVIGVFVHARGRLTGLRHYSAVLLIGLYAWLILSAVANNDAFLVVEMTKALVVGYGAAILWFSTRTGGAGLAWAAFIGLSPAFTILLTFGLGVVPSPRVISPYFKLPRLVLARQDPNATSTVLTALTVCALGLCLFSPRRLARPWVLAIGGGAALLLNVLTLSRGGLIASAIAVSVMLWLSVRRGTARTARRVAPILLIGLATALIGANLTLFGTAKGDGVGDLINKMVGLLDNKGLDTRGVALAQASAWLRDSPIFGGGLANYRQDSLDAGRTIFWSHNTYFDFALAGGVIGGLLFTALCAAGLISHKRISDLNDEHIPVLLMYMVLLVAMLSLSAATDKTFWILWFVSALRYSYVLEQRTARSDRPWRRRVGGAQVPCGGAAPPGDVRRDRAELLPGI